MTTQHDESISLRDFIEEYHGKGLGLGIGGGPVLRAHCARRVGNSEDDLEGLVGASGFEPPASCSRSRFQPLLKLVESCCLEVIAVERFGWYLLKRVGLCCFRGIQHPQFRPQRSEVNASFETIFILTLRGCSQLLSLRSVATSNCLSFGVQSKIVSLRSTQHCVVKQAPLLTLIWLWPSRKRAAHPRLFWSP